MAKLAICNQAAIKPDRCMSKQSSSQDQAESKQCAQVRLLAIQEVQAVSKPYFSIARTCWESTVHVRRPRRLIGGETQVASLFQAACCLSPSDPR